MSDPIPAEDRPHRVSALTGVDPDADTTGIAPENRAQGTGRHDDDAVAERRADADAARDEQAAAARASTTSTSYAADEDTVGHTVQDVQDFLNAATSDEDRAAREDAVRAVEDAREGGPRKGVTDELGG